MIFFKRGPQLRMMGFLDEFSLSSRARPEHDVVLRALRMILYFAVDRMAGIEHWDVAREHAEEDKEEDQTKPLP